MVFIITDYREDESGIPELLQNMDVIIEKKQLGIADYVIAEDMAIERKEGADLLASILDNRFFEQHKDLTNTYPRVVYLIENFHRAFADPGYKATHRSVDQRIKDRQMRINATFGSLASLTRQFKVRIIPTNSNEQSARFIYYLAKQEQEPENKHFTERSLPKRLKTVKEQRRFLLEGLADTGGKTVDLLLEKFKTPLNIMNAIMNTTVLYTKTGNPKGLSGPMANIKGIGPKYIIKNRRIIGD